MRLLKKFLGYGVLGSTALGIVAASARSAVIEFSEVATPNGTSLTGSNAYAPYGIHFTGGATYVNDNRFIGAGNDSSGVATSPTTPLFGITFDTAATSVSFKGLDINTDFAAEAYNSQNQLLGTFFVPPSGNSGVSYVSDTFSGLGPISRVDFHDNGGFVGVGQLSFSVVPEPAGLFLCGAGVALLFSGRGRNRKIEPKSGQ